MPLRIQKRGSHESYPCRAQGGRSTARVSRFRNPFGGGMKWCGDGRDGDVVLAANGDLPHVTGNVSWVMAKNFTVNAGVTIAPASNVKAMIVFATGDVVINGILAGDGKGKGGAAPTAAITPTDLLADLGLKSDWYAGYKVVAVGANGGAEKAHTEGTYVAGNPGSAGGARQSGGGGSGQPGKHEAGGNPVVGKAGGKGTAFCGGGGGGGAVGHPWNGEGQAATAADDAGAGGNGGYFNVDTGMGGGGGGAGNPVGTCPGTYHNGSPGTGAGGPIVYILCKGIVTVNSGGRVSSDGVAGGAGNSTEHEGGGGGGAGGGAVLIVSGSYINNGTVRAQGGQGGACGEAGGGNAGDGGAGSVQNYIKAA